MCVLSLEWKREEVIDGDSGDADDSISHCDNKTHSLLAGLR